MTAHATRPAERKRASALEAAGLTPQRAVHWNLGPPELYEHAVRRAEGVIAEGGAFAAVTAPHTGRSPNDKFIVREPASADEMWWNRGNQPLEADALERLKASLLAHLAEQELFVRDQFAGADAEHRCGVGEQVAHEQLLLREVQELFVRDLFAGAEAVLRVGAGEQVAHEQLLL